jgi:hypothetical protein
MKELDSVVQLPMFELATQAVENFVSDLGGFTPFALATLNDGQIQILETSGEFPDVESAQSGLVSHLISLRTEGQIIGCLLCVPVEVSSAPLQAAAIMEIEAADCSPVRAIRQIRHDSGVPALSDKVEFMPGEARVF